MHPLLLLGVVLLGMMTTRASTAIMFASTGSIQLEGNAMADIARAIPGLTTLSGMNVSIDSMIACATYGFSFYFYDAMRCVNCLI